MARKFNSDIDLDNVARGINSLDPVNNGDLVPKNYVLNYAVEALGASSTTSTSVYTTKATLTTPALPAGDYIIEWSMKWGASNANRGIQVGVFVGGVEIVNHINFSASIVDNPMIGGRKKQTFAAGIKVIYLKFFVGVGSTTITTTEALLTLRRIA